MASLSGFVNNGSYFFTKKAGVDSKFNNGSKSLSIFINVSENFWRI